jgi:Protein of unknown function (DUF3551)
MKTLAVAVGILIGTGLNAKALAQNQPWCAYFSGGPTNCDFATFEECLQAIHGKTGLCDRNNQSAQPSGPQSTPAPSAQPSRVPLRRRRHHKES